MLRGPQQKPQTIHHDNDGAAFVADNSNGQGNPTEKREGYEHNHRPQRDNQVLTNNAPGTLAQAEGGKEILQAIMHEDNIGLLECGIRTAGAHGHTDVGGGHGEQISQVRAASVRDTMLRGGISARTIIARGLGNSRPLVSNSGANGREQNRRVEIVVAGDSIGYLAHWDKPYPIR